MVHDVAVDGKRGVDDNIFDRRALMLGAILFGALCFGAALWRIAVKSDSVLKKPAEFEFSVQEHQVEEFKIREVQRDIVHERSSDVPETFESVKANQREERPDIHITTNPERVGMTQAQEVIQSSNVQIETPKIEVGGTEVGISDAPQEISQVSETVNYALQPIAAETAGAADIFKYDNPTPRDKMQIHYMNTGPSPGRALKVMPRAFGDQDAPSVGKLGPLNINLNGTGDFFKTMSRSGDVKSKSAVDSALHWLAVHQEPDGLWSAEKYEGDKSGDLSVTALACLAFMGGGHTARKGEYSRNVLKGIEAILRNQKPDGALGGVGKGDGAHLMYTHAICTIALCESFGRARDERIGAAAQKAVAYCEKAINEDGGWRYRPRSQDSDSSVSAWVMQALKTAKLAQIKFDHAVFSRGLAYMDSVTDQGAGKDSSGGVAYQFSNLKERDGGKGGNGHPALTCAGMLVRQFNGMGVKNPLLVKAAELTRQRAPNFKQKDFYYWYYATYAMHNMGGEYRVWWNQRIRDTLLDNQVHGGEHAGSWDPKGDHWANSGGRVYTTALGGLCLEVYYRYSEALNSFGAAPDLDELFFEKE